MNCLAIDYGTRKSGLAINIENIAIPLMIVETKTLLEEIKKIVTERKIEMIILGMANNVDDSESLHSKRIKSFTQILKRQIPRNIEIGFHDERFTSYEAVASMENIGEKNFDPKRLDDMAASIILQSYLDIKK